MQARYYLPWMGRFGSPDPGSDQHFEDTQSWNIYSYVRNNPTMSFDPTGMWDWKKTLDRIQTGLDAAGMVPGLGEVADGASGLISLGRGDWTGAGLSLASMVPIGGQAAGAAKLTRRAVKEGAEVLAKKAAKEGAKEVATKTDRLKKHILNGELDAARREAAGEVVARKADGTPWDHVHELRDAQRGLLNRVDSLKKQLGNTNLTDVQRSKFQKELGEASKLLDKTEKYLPR